MSAEFRNLEYPADHQPARGGEKLGVIGNTARNNLKRMPSGMYWAALGAWHILNVELLGRRLLPTSVRHRQLAKRTATTDDPGGA